MQADGMDEIDHSDFEGAVQYLAEFGGSLALRYGEEIGVFLLVELERRSISIGMVFDLWHGRDDQLSASLEQLFKLLCVKLRPVIGFVTDEETLGAAIPGRQLLPLWQRIQYDLDRLQSPTVLFWLTYLSNEYLLHIDAESFRHLLVRPMERLDHGMLLYLADAPWNERRAMLQDDGRYALPSY